MYNSAPLVTTHQRGTRAKNAPGLDAGKFFVNETWRYFGDQIQSMELSACQSLVKNILNVLVQSESRNLCNERCLHCTDYP